MNKQFINNFLEHKCIILCKKLKMYCILSFLLIKNKSYICRCFYCRSNLDLFNCRNLDMVQAVNISHLGDIHTIQETP